jgi:SPP1 gp7 family putative phage head morphogenesis protein
MLELEYNEFMEIVEKNPRQQDKRILHYLEEGNQFTLFIRSVDYWEYFTVVPKSVIQQFGEQYEASIEEAVRDFKRSILHDAVPLKEKKEEILDLPDTLTKEVEIDAGEEMIDEADGYVEFLRFKMNQWEKTILNFLEETLKDEIQKDYVDKSFGDFISRLFNTVNTAGFMTKLKRVIKLDVKKGIKAAEEELNMDIGVGVDFDKKVKLFADRQLDGFTIDGKRWKGLKGVAQDVQNNVSNIVANGINEKQGVVQIRKDIQAEFIKNKGGKVKGKITKGRAMRIARTESNRFINAGKLSAYKDSGLKGKKKWVSFVDDRTTQICKELDGQTEELHGIFKHSSGKTYEHPPHGPNCRSIIEFDLE